MRISDYLTGLFLILLTWTADPIVGKVAENVAKTDFVADSFLDWTRALLSTLTTIVVLVTAVIKLRKERRNK